MHHKNSKKAGMPQGSVVYVGKIKEFKPEVTSTLFYEGAVTITPVNDINNIADVDGVQWLDVVGLHDEGIVSLLGKRYDIHPLFLEDVVNTTQRPKVDELDDTLMIILKLFDIEEGSEALNSHQVAIILKNNTVITLSEEQDNRLDSLRNRLKATNNNILNRGADYLFVSIIDTLVDSYYSVIEDYIQIVDSLDPIRNEHRRYIQYIQHISSSLLLLRKGIFPLREASGKLGRGDFISISYDNYKYFRDINDHVIQMLDNIDFYIMMVNNIKELHLANISYRMNKVMQTLTTISAIFIPLTFLVGVYGMNFKFMPELSWRYGYLGVWIVMIVIVVVLYYHFKRKKWF